MAKVSSLGRNFGEESRLVFPLMSFPGCLILDFFYIDHAHFDLFLTLKRDLSREREETSTIAGNSTSIRYVPTLFNLEPSLSRSILHFRERYKQSEFVADIFRGFTDFCGAYDNKSCFGDRLQQRKRSSNHKEYFCKFLVSNNKPKPIFYVLLSVDSSISDKNARISL